jgi:hypothetical protein
VAGYGLHCPAAVSSDDDLQVDVIPGGNVSTIPQQYDVDAQAATQSTVVSH